MRGPWSRATRFRTGTWSTSSRWKRLYISPSKHVRYVPLDDGRVIRVETYERSGELSLDEGAAPELAKMGRSLEAYFGHPQDVEWVVGAGSGGEEEVFVVQSIPVTVATTVTKRS